MTKNTKNDTLIELINKINNHKNFFVSLISVTSFLIIWEITCNLELIKPLFISSPSRIFKAAIWLFNNGFWSDIQVSATEFAIGFLLAIAFGIPAGICLGWYKSLELIFDPFISSLYATPRVALLPLLILWLGIGIKSKIAVVFLGCIFPLLVNTITAMKTLDPLLLKCSKSFGANDLQIFTTIAIPSSVPFILSGMRLAVGRGLVGIVVGELVASTAGVGHMMSIAGSTFQTDKLFVGIIFLASSGYVMTELLKQLEKKFDKWR